jgi:hypothetical protein
MKDRAKMARGKAAPKLESNMGRPHDRAGAAKGHTGRAKWKSVQV